MDIDFLTPDDRTAWEVLARGYKDFYNSPTSRSEFDGAWQRLIQRDGVHGLGAKVDGTLVGIAHYLFHTTVWSPRSCYLQDIFTAPEARGRGVAGALIDAVAAKARAEGADRYYWQTQANNSTARRLYDRVAEHRGFIRYDYALDRSH